MEKMNPFHPHAKPSGAACNLGCRYCFFLSKENLYPQESTGMSDETLEACLYQLVAATAGVMASLLRKGRFADEIMQVLAEGGAP